MKNIAANISYLSRSSPYVSEDSSSDFQRESVNNDDDIKKFETLVKRDNPDNHKNYQNKKLNPQQEELSDANTEQIISQPPEIVTAISENYMANIDEYLEQNPINEHFTSSDLLSEVASASIIDDSNILNSNPLNINISENQQLSSEEISDLSVIISEGPIEVSPEKTELIAEINFNNIPVNIPINEPVIGEIPELVSKVENEIETNNFDVHETSMLLAHQNSSSANMPKDEIPNSNDINQPINIGSIKTINNESIPQNIVPLIKENIANANIQRDLLTPKSEIPNDILVASTILSEDLTNQNKTDLVEKIGDEFRQAPVLQASHNVKESGTVINANVVNENGKIVETGIIINTLQDGKDGNELLTKEMAMLDPESDEDSYNRDIISKFSENIEVRGNLRGYVAKIEENRPLEQVQESEIPALSKDGGNIISTNLRSSVKPKKEILSKSDNLEQEEGFKIVKTSNGDIEINVIQRSPLNNIQSNNSNLNQQNQDQESVDMEFTTEEPFKFSSEIDSSKDDSRKSLSYNLNPEIKEIADLEPLSEAISSNFAIEKIGNENIGIVKNIESQKLNDLTDITSQIAKGLEQQQLNDQVDTSFTVKLNPESLGEVRIIVNFDANRAAKITFISENSESLAALSRESEIRKLEETLKNIGITEGMNMQFNLKDGGQGNQAYQKMHNLFGGSFANENGDKTDTMVKANEEGIYVNNREKVDIRA